MFSQLSLLLSPCAFTIWILIIRVQTQLNLSLKFSVLTLNSFVISGDFLWCTLNYTASHERNGNEVTLWYVSWLPLKELRASGSFFCCARHFFGVEMNGRNLQSSFAGRRQDSYLFLRKPGGIKSEDMVAMPRAQGQGWGDAAFLWWCSFLGAAEAQRHGQTLVWSCCSPKLPVWWGTAIDFSEVSLAVWGEVWEHKKDPTAYAHG